MKIYKKWNEVYGFNPNFLLEWKTYLVSEYIPQRSYEQSKLYWALLTLVERETWNDREYLHELMKMQFLSHKKLVKLWKSRKYVRKVESTAKLKRSDFSTFFTKVEVYFAELWYHLPPIESPEFLSLCNS